MAARFEQMDAFSRFGPKSLVCKRDVDRKNCFQFRSLCIRQLIRVEPHEPQPGAVFRPPVLRSVRDLERRPRRTTGGHLNGSVDLDLGPAGLLARISRLPVERRSWLRSAIQTWEPVYRRFRLISVLLLTRLSLRLSALFGEIPIHGRQPVTILGLALHD
jgi:hypothetical protein